MVEGTETQSVETNWGYRIRGDNSGNNGEEIESVVFQMSTMESDGEANKVTHGKRYTGNEHRWLCDYTFSATQTHIHTGTH